MVDAMGLAPVLDLLGQGVERRGRQVPHTPSRCLPPHPGLDIQIIARRGQHHHRPPGAGQPRSISLPRAASRPVWRRIGPSRAPARMLNLSAATCGASARTSSRGQRSRTRRTWAGSWKWLVTTSTPMTTRTFAEGDSQTGMVLTRGLTLVRQPPGEALDHRGDGGRRDGAQMDLAHLGRTMERLAVPRHPGALDDAMPRSTRAMRLDVTVGHRVAPDLHEVTGCLRATPTHTDRSPSVSSRSTPATIPLPPPRLLASPRLAP